MIQVVEYAKFAVRRNAYFYSFPLPKIHKGLETNDFLFGGLGESQGRLHFLDVESAEGEEVVGSTQVLVVERQHFLSAVPKLRLLESG